MASVVQVLLDDGDEFDRIIGDSLPEGADVRIITKDRGTKGGMPCAMIAFTSQLPDGTLATSQAVVTAAVLMDALRIMQGRYGGLGLGPLGN